MPLDKLFDALADSAKSSDFSGTANPEVFASLLLSKKARKKLKKQAKKNGGAAAIASLGFLAFQQVQASRATRTPAAPRDTSSHAKPRPTPPPLPPTPEPLVVSECLRMNMILTMISAASADGKIDDTELDHLHAAIEEAPIGAEDRERLNRALERPLPVEDLAGFAFSPMEACELYGAACAAIEVDTPAEKLFLRRFAKALHLDDDLVAMIEAGLTT